MNLPIIGYRVFQSDIAAGKGYQRALENMKTDPRRALEVRIAYLRLAAREGGLPLDTPGGRAYTRDLREVVESGDLAVMRAARGSNRPDVLHATPQGIDRLASVLERYGDDFGPTSVLGMVENVRGR